DDRFNTGQALINLGTTFHSAENYDQAKRCYDESLVILQEIRDLGNQSLVMANLGELALAKHQFAESISYSKQGLALATQADDEWAVLICWINLSDAALGQKDQEMAQKYLAEALPLAAQSAEPALMLRTLLHLGRYYLLRGQSEKAIPLLGLVIHHEATYDEHRQVAREVLFSAGLPIPSESNTSLEAVILTELI
ncbi:MAG TPA: hypothetical protein DEH22_01525, partial [Chloroflexi bacterium]|nr:hypothetical protein [Chloroflexota bacterium]